MNAVSSHDDTSSNRLAADFKVVMDDAEALLKATAQKGDDQLDEIRARSRESLRVLGERIAQSQAALVDGGRKAAKATDVYVHDHPWASLGVAAGVGLVFGLLLRRR